MTEQFLHGVEVVQIDDGIRPIRTVASSIVGLVGTAPDAEASAFPEDTPVLVTGPRMAATLGAAGTLRDAYDALYAQGVAVAIIVRVDAGADTAAAKAAVTGVAAEQTGIYALETAAALTGQTPRILAAPGFTTPEDPAVIDGTAGALQTVAGKLRGIAVIDGPNTTEADALTYADLLGSDRLFLVDPAVRVYDAAAQATETRPASGYVAGVISATDAARGFWWSPSNQLIAGITGVARPIDFSLSQTATQANRLNEANVATVIRRDGFRVWGNRTLASDALWTFLPVRRTADMIYDSVERAHAWALDRPFSQQLLLDIRNSVQAYIDGLVAQGALLGGRVWLDEELNTEAKLKAGQLYLDFDIEPPAPLERLTFRAHRNGEYYDELVDAVAAA